MSWDLIANHPLLAPVAGWMLAVTPWVAIYAMSKVGNFLSSIM